MGIRLIAQKRYRRLNADIVRLTCELMRTGGRMPVDGADDDDNVDSLCEAFAHFVDAKSPFTYRHSAAVAEAAEAIAVTLQLPADRVRLVRRAALLHDLGKLGVPNAILEKPGELTAEERAVVLEHPRLTREILARIESFAELAEIAGAHHEKLDGTGYPEGLVASQISLEARIVAVADVYQAMTERRPYREGMSHADAMACLRELAGTELDARCIEALAVARNPWTVWTANGTTTVTPPRKRPHADTAFAAPAARQA